MELLCYQSFYKFWIIFFAIARDSHRIRLEPRNISIYSLDHLYIIYASYSVPAFGIQSIDPFHIKSLKCIDDDKCTCAIDNFDGNLCLYLYSLILHHF